MPTDTSARRSRARRFLSAMLIDGLCAGTLSAAVLAWRGRVEHGRAAAPLNAPAHWFFGRASLRQDAPSLRHTVIGLAVHQASSLFWGAFQAAWLARVGRVDAGRASACAVAATAAAATVDLKLVPERLTPGFERRLTRKSVACVYAAFAVGLALSALARARVEPRSDPV